MSIELTALERGDTYPGDLAEALAALRERIMRAQQVQVEQDRRAIIVLEGPEGAAKLLTLRELAAAFDPRFASTYTVLADQGRASDGHWLARFWRDLPVDGRTALYFHSWYCRVLEDRVLGLAQPSEVARAYDEINEFEAQQRDHGTLITKLYFHVTPEVQAERLAARALSAADRLLSGPGELRSAEARQAYDAAVQDMLAQTHTRWSPWIALDANDDGSSMVAALGAIAGAMEKAFPDVGDAGGEAVVPLRRRGLTNPL